VQIGPTPGVVRDLSCCIGVDDVGDMGAVVASRDAIAERDALHPAGDCRARGCGFVRFGFPVLIRKNLGSG
jgi:hypothetical protein